MKTRHKRLALIMGGLGLLTAAVMLVLSAFQDNLVFFHSPSEILQGQATPERMLRIGGIVEEGSVQRQADGLSVRFAVTDTASSIPVEYQGSLPDLFREGKGVVAQGRLDEAGLFHASQVLAKHDENYMPPEAADALQQAQKSMLTVVQP